MEKLVRFTEALLLYLKEAMPWIQAEFVDRSMLPEAVQVNLNKDSLVTVTKTPYNDVYTAHSRNAFFYLIRDPRTRQYFSTHTPEDCAFALMKVSPTVLPTSFLVRWNSFVSATYQSPCVLCGGPTTVFIGKHSHKLVRICRNLMCRYVEQDFSAPNRSVSSQTATDEVFMRIREECMKSLF